MIALADYQFFHKLTELSFVDKIYLYGSRARATSRERSDIDLAILCPSASDHDWLTILEIINEADTLLGVDCVRLDRITDSRFMKEIQRDGKLLYKRENNDK